MKTRPFLLISVFLIIILAFQNCTQLGPPVAFNKDSKSLNSSEYQGGNGGGYEGKLTFLAVEAGFTCEDKPAPKSILRRDENKIWYLTVNEKSQCGRIRGLVVNDVTYTTGSHRLTYRGAEYILDTQAPWDKDSVLTDYLREFKVSPASDNNSKDALPGDGICADLNGQCTLQAAADETNSKPDSGAIILVSPGQYTLSQEIGITSKAFTWIKGDSHNTTTLSGGNQTRIFSSDQATLKLSDLTLTAARSIEGVGTGGGLYSQGSHLFIYDLQFKNNFATHYGAGIVSTSGNLYIRRSLFDSNSLGSDRGLNFGDAVHSALNFEFIIEESEFLNHNNSASDRGVIYSFQDSRFSIQNSLIYNNRIPGPALALIATFEKIEIENTTVAESDGWGLYVYNRANDPVREMTIQNSTFHNNLKGVLNNSGSFLINWTNATGASNRLQISNSAFSKATTGACGTPWPTLLPASTSLVLKNNIEASQGCEGLTDPTTKIVSSLQLATSPTYNGGFVRNLMPLSTSPLIDSGDNLTCSAADQRGSSRPKDFLGSGAICDVGSIEL